ncbi:MAG: hypothetical protein FWF29_03290, partial [Treponema sp.]|nr:hypothetical protein [Treponema sp.]
MKPRHHSFLLSHSFLRIIIIALITAFFFSGCTAIKGKEITDRTGRPVTIKGPINRIVSTAPSNTEIIVDLGMADKLVAVDRYSLDIPGIPAGIALIDFSYPDAEA